MTTPLRDPTSRTRPTLPSVAPPTLSASIATALAALLLLHLSNPLVWTRNLPGWWFPPAGIGLVLVTWFGKRYALLVALDILLVTVQAMIVEASNLWADGWPAVLGPFWDAMLLAGEILAAWTIYNYGAKESRRRGDPTSATLFLLFIPILSAGTFGALHALPRWFFGGENGPLLGSLLVGFWLSHALGFLVVCPPLFANVTPLLIRHRLIQTGDDEPTSREATPLNPMTGWDYLEIGTMAVCMAFLGLIQGVIQRHREVAQWHLWGIPLLIIVWTSLRQGMRGGTIVASSAVVLQLILFGFLRKDIEPDPFYQVNLLAQCGSSLLVAAGANWLRLNEARYREVVSRIPVVLYSARVTWMPHDGRGTPRAELIFVSEAARNLLGIEPAVLQGDYRSWFDRIHPEDQEILEAAIRQLSRQRQPVTCEYRLGITTESPVTPPPGLLAVTTRADVLRATLKATYGPRVIAYQAPRERLRCVRDTLAPLFNALGELIGWDGVVSDITEQRFLADDLRRTTSMLHALVANLPTGVFFVQGEEGLPILVNTRARQLLGQVEDRTAGVDRLVATYRLCRSDGSPYPTEALPVVAALRHGLTAMRDDILVTRPDGSRIPLVAWAAPIDLGGQGRPDAAVWVFEDLTALQQAQEARQESEARLSALFEAMAEGVILVDERKTVVTFNPAACTILDIPPERLTHLPIDNPELHLLHEDGTRMTPQEYPALVSQKTGQPIRGVVVGMPIRKGQETRWLLVNAIPLPPSGAGPGSLPRVVTTFADITSARRALDAVRASEEKYRVLVETLPIPLAQFDVDGRATYLNPSARANSGYEVEDLSEPGAWEKLLNPEESQVARNAFHKALQGQTVRIEARYRTKEGRERVGYVITEPRRGGQEAGVTALIVDVTRERQLEKELERSQRMELIGRLASGIFHDFNNLLTVVLTLARLAQDALPKGHSVIDDLQRIHDAGEQAANLSTQLLAFSKNRKPTPRRIDINRVASRTLELLRATLPRFIQITPQLAPGELFILADEMQVQQVLINLCLNARDAMPQGGTLIVRTATVHGGPRPVLLSVQDTGEGISEAVQALIFDAFFTTKEHGTGLGLAVVRQIVEGTGGIIEVQSGPGEGARFDVWLPAGSPGG